MSLIRQYLENGLIASDQIGEIETKIKEGDSLDKILIDEYLVDEEKVLEIKKNYFSDIEFFEVPKNFMISEEVLSYIPFDMVKRFKMVPLRVSDDGYFDVGMLDPEDLAAQTTLQFISTDIGYPYRKKLISYQGFNRIKEFYSGAKNEVSKALDQYGISEEEEMKMRQKGVSDEIIKDDGPIAKIVKNIIKQAAQTMASDIHIETREKEIVVRYRIDGELESDLKLPKKISDSIVARVKIMSKLKIDEKRKPQDGRFSGVFEGRKIDFRVSSFPTFYGEKIVMRLLEQDRGALPIEELGLTEENLNTVKDIIKHSYGIILVCGPTGSGKTNTLYSLLNEIDRETKNVISLENPIELKVPGVSQSQVHPEIGYTFATGLRSVLRQDPDIIMVGEIRDKETAKLAVEASLTGHLVFSTIHTNTAADVPQRLIDMGVEPYLIGPTLIATIGQRLIRKIIPKQREELPLSPEVKEFIKNRISDLPAERQNIFQGYEKMYRPVPTQKSNGFKGRTAVFEILKMDKDIQRAILDNPSSLVIFEIARKKGFITFKEDGILKALKGITSFEEVMKL